MITGELTIDGVAYAVEDLELPSAADPTQTIKIKDLVLIPAVDTPLGRAPGGMAIRVRFAADAFDEFVAKMQSARVVLGTAADLGRLANGNGGA